MKNLGKDLDELFNQKRVKEQKGDEKIKEVESEVEKFYSSVVASALNEIKSALEKHNRKVDVKIGKKYGSISIRYQNILELDYSVNARISPRGASPYPITRGTDTKTGKTYSAEGHYGISSGDYDISNLTKEVIIQDILREYKFKVFGIYE
ncbi:hypothetical protein KAX02_12310 [candidate division WOR-3 bacterium]|nr:hypothetical protein [candidate division WOR-3 bacterium]